MKRLVATMGVVVAAAGLLAGCPSLGGLTGSPDGGTPDGASPDVTVDASQPEAAPPTDAGDAGDASDAPTDTGTCAHARWPGPPDAAPGGGDSGGHVGPIVLALQSFDLKPTDTIGFDLDNQCTCPGPESCGLPDASVPAITCDIADGRDPVFNRLIVQLAMVIPPVGPDGVQAVVTYGDADWLLRISGYNGLADDPDVAVELFVSTGTVPDDAGVHAMPRFDGTDQWQILDTSTVPTGGSSFVSAYLDLGAYVTGHVLVAHPANNVGLVPTFDEYFGPGVGNGNPLIIYLADVVVMGTLAQASDGSFSLQNGFFGARVPTDGTSGILEALTQVGLCPNMGLYTEAVGQLCPSRDLATAAADDNTGAPCGAASFGASFVATPDLLGPIVTRTLVPTACPDAGVPACP